MTLLLVALATTRIVEWIKEMVWWPMRLRTKGALTIAVSIALCVGLKKLDMRDTILLGLASAGLASILRAIWRLLSVIGDQGKLVVMQRSRRPRGA